MLYFYFFVNLLGVILSVLYLPTQVEYSVSLFVVQVSTILSLCYTIKLINMDRDIETLVNEVVHLKKGCTILEKAKKKEGETKNAGINEQ